MGLAHSKTAWPTPDKIKRGQETLVRVA
jgi:hypothetical protein